MIDIMTADLIQYLPQIISVCFIAIFMAVSPGSDFVMVTRNSIFYGRSSGLYAALGISIAIWIHVAYSIAGLALIISKSIILFSIVKYLGAAYLIYIGWKTFQGTAEPSNDEQTVATLSPFNSFKVGFISNALNPKTTIFFLSVFTQVSTPETPIIIQILYGAIISAAHLLWFCLVSILLSQPRLLQQFYRYKGKIEKVIGSVLIAFGLKVAATSN